MPELLRAISCKAWWQTWLHSRACLLNARPLVPVDLGQGRLQQAVVIRLAVPEGEVLQLHNQRVQAQHARQWGKHLQQMSA